MSKHIYYIENVDMGESSRYEPQWSNAELSTYGDSLADLLDNATYFFIDQDGGDLGDSIADDQDAINYITDWYNENKCPEIEPRKEIDPMTLAKNFEES